MRKITAQNMNRIAKSRNVADCKDSYRPKAFIKYCLEQIQDRASQGEFSMKIDHHTNNKVNKIAIKALRNRGFRCVNYNNWAEIGVSWYRN